MRGYHNCCAADAEEPKMTWTLLNFFRCEGINLNKGYELYRRFRKKKKAKPSVVIDACTRKGETVVPRSAYLARPSGESDRFVHSYGQGFDHPLKGQKFQPAISCSVLCKRLELCSDHQCTSTAAKFGSNGPKVDSCVH